MDLLNEKAFKMIDKGNRPVQRKQLSAWPVQNSNRNEYTALNRENTQLVLHKKVPVKNRSDLIFGLEVFFVFVFVTYWRFLKIL